VVHPRNGRRRCRWFGQFGHVHVVEAFRAQSFDLLVDRRRELGERRAGPLPYCVRHQHVLGERHGVLQHPVHEDHVDARERGAAPRLRHDDLSVMSHDLHRQLPGLLATVAPADPQQLHALLLVVEGAVHGGRDAGERARDRLGGRLGRVEKGRVSLQAG
jgi:hypothetical protein